MRPNAYRDEDADAYWRRRVILLAAGMVVLGLLAWALPGSGGARPGAGGSGRQPVLANTGLPAAAYAPASEPPPANAAPELATASPTPATPSGSPRPRPRHRPHANGQCPARSVVMTVLTSKPSYTSKQRPEFTVYAVSTMASGCEIKFGTGAVRVIVTRHGRVVWNSAECPSSPIKTVRLARGVPTEMSVTWNRHTAFGCRGWLPANSYGRFTASARDSGGESSAAIRFQLAR